MKKQWEQLGMPEKALLNEMVDLIKRGIKGEVLDLKDLSPFTAITSQKPDNQMMVKLLVIWRCTQSGLVDAKAREYYNKFITTTKENNMNENNTTVNETPNTTKETTMNNNTVNETPKAENTPFIDKIINPEKQAKIVDFSKAKAVWLRKKGSELIEKVKLTDQDLKENDNFVVRNLTKGICNMEDRAKACDASYKELQSGASGVKHPTVNKVVNRVIKSAVVVAGVVMKVLRNVAVRVCQAAKWAWSKLVGLKNSVVEFFNFDLNVTAENMSLAA